MKGIAFTKMVAAGNDFIVIEHKHGLAKSRNFGNFARKLCDRKRGIGADGVLVLEKSRKADLLMRIINADGSEAEMCGNGARCAVLYASTMLSMKDKKHIRLQTRAGIVDSAINHGLVKVKLTEPYALGLDIPLVVNGRALRVNFINTGVPHAVIFVEGLELIDVVQLGRAIRNHAQFSPRGTNVNFVEVTGNRSIAVRTYERGVEDETLACGTGSTASALVFALRSGLDKKVVVLTKSRELLNIYFDRCDDRFRDVWLEGKASFVFKGTIL